MNRKHIYFKNSLVSGYVPKKQDDFITVVLSCGNPPPSEVSSFPLIELDIRATCTFRWGSGGTTNLQLN